jgi:hypothetical protein
MSLNFYKALAEDCDCSKKLFDIRINKKFGFIDANGKVVVKPIFEEVQPFDDGLTTAIIESKIVGNREDGSPIYEIKSAIVHYDGKVIELPNTWISSFSEGLAFARVANKFVFLDTFGRTVFEVPDNIIQEVSDIDTILPFSDGLVRFPMKDRTFVVFDKLGNFTRTNDRFLEFGENGLRSYLDKDGYSILDKDNNYIIGPKKNLISSVDNLYYSASEDQEGVYQFFDTKGKEVFQVKADYIGDFREGLAPINIGEKWGFVNTNGKVVIPIKYKDANSFSDGLASVIDSNDKVGFINTKGKMVIPAVYESGAYQAEFDCGLIYVQKGKWEGYINKKGVWVWKKKV